MIDDITVTTRTPLSGVTDLHGKYIVRPRQDPSGRVEQPDVQNIEKYAHDGSEEEAVAVITEQARLRSLVRDTEARLTALDLAGKRQPQKARKLASQCRSLLSRSMIAPVEVGRIERDAQKLFGAAETAGQREAAQE